ncbi:MAG: NapH/MauN family ferredoxin-type protein [Chlorobi bacterium]|nr:NapH/MauN family ferredoxin-type protein [Chlorobiota bacterium]
MFNRNKKKPPIAAKPIAEMPHSLLGQDYKVWCKSQKGNHKWRNIRWTVLIGVNLLFVLSFFLDLSFLEGSLSGSRAMGFYLIDTFNALQVVLISLPGGYFPSLTMNFWIGFFTILFLSTMGGRTYCSWVCPYHFLAEMAERLHDFLVKKKKVKEHSFNIYLRFVFWGGFLLLALLTKNIVFENLNPIGILSRAMIYGPGLILLWVLALLIFEIVYSKRFWCRYVCPVGATWAITGKAAPIRVKFDHDKCGYCRDCQDVCLVPHVLWFVQRGKATQKTHYAGPDCTRCGLCIDTCAGKALTFTIKGLDKLI